MNATERVLLEFRVERARQEKRWGEQNHPNGTGSAADKESAKLAQAACDAAMRDGTITFRHILAEEVMEAFAEGNPRRLRAELVQVGALAAQWIEAIDRAEVRAGERLDQALIHAASRDHAHQPSACDGCKQVQEELRAASLRSRAADSRPTPNREEP